ncbi:hypothetical protein N7470_009463 [Penicillium chermesinum]|nr:hypothetical protein N7470_009463 [Penicillium chermesinum]
MPFPETTLADSSSTGTIDQPEKKEPQVDSRGGQDALSWMTDILDQRSVHQNRTTGGHKKGKILQRKRVDTRIKGHGPPQTHLSLSDRIFGKEVTPRRSRRKTVSKQNTAPSQPESAPTKPADHLSIKSKGETKGPSADAKKYSSKKQETKARRNRSSFHTSKRVHETRGASRAYSTSRTLQANGGLEESWDCSRELPESGDISDEAGITNKSDPTSAPREVASPESKAVDPASKPLFWSHSSQTRPDGGKLIVHYCRNLESTEEVAKLFHNSPVIGFDMEWKSNASANHSVQSNLSLIQIANEERIALFQIALFKPAKGLSDLVAPSLKLILESPEITKVGVSIKADTTRLRKYLGINAVSIFELSHLFKLVKFGQSNPKLVNKRNINLSDQVEEHLGLPLNKSEDVRCSDWARPLNYNQVQCMLLPASFVGKPEMF